MKLIILGLLLVPDCGAAVAHAAAGGATGDEQATAQYRQWVEAMKTSERGPFQRIRWFCNDGSVHPPKPYPCGERGGGHQHGEWSAQTKKLRAQGYRVATLLAGADPEKLAAEADFRETWNHLLIEKFLMAVDNGWIMRRALFYRGAIQEEDERAAARELLITLAGKPEWIGSRFPSLRIGVRLLPHGEDTASVQKVRQVSASLSDQDAGFKDLRAKIHGSPDKDDARRVRDYAAGVKQDALRKQYQELAAEIDRVYAAVPLAQRLQQTAKTYTAAPWLQKRLVKAAEAIAQDDAPGNVYAVTADLLADLRDALPKIKQASARLKVLDLGLAVEADNFSASAVLREQMTERTRKQRAALLAAAVEGAYGTGMINRRERAALRETLNQLEKARLPLKDYKKHLNYLGRVPGWGTQGLRFHFYEAMQ
ncbi:MAG: hypothetical protein QNJ61_09840, partial [Desulfobacterales bacterium]|nr:hypothetical protein [Desulfobacterales bacterium]